MDGVWGGQPCQSGPILFVVGLKNVRKGAISPRERCSTLICADKMLHIKGEGRRPRGLIFSTKCFDVSIRGVFDILWRSHYRATREM